MYQTEYVTSVDFKNLDINSFHCKIPLFLHRNRIRCINRSRLSLYLIYNLR